MDASIIGLIGIIMLVVMLFLGLHVFVAMGLTGLCGFWIVTNNFEATRALAAVTAYSVCATYDFSVIPLFILLGMVIYESGMATSIYDALYRWIGAISGGLAIATVFAVAVFSAVSGSSLASAVTFGKLAVPEMISKGYHRGIACALVAGAATQDALIPPSGLLVIYAILTEQSIGKCLMAGFIPGILSCILYAGVLLILAKIRPNWMPRGPNFSKKEKLESLRAAWPIPLLALLVLGAIYTGICTPTEAAAVGTSLAILLGAFIVGIRKLRLLQGLRETVMSSAFIYAVIIGAFTFSSFIAVSRIPVLLSDVIKGGAISREVVLLIILILFFVLGVIMNSVAWIVISIPIFFPVVSSLGYDPIWFGVIVVKMAGIGMLTPPVGMTVYAVKGTIGELARLEDIFKAVWIFVITDIVCLALLILFPSISLFLPAMMAR